MKILVYNLVLHWLCKCVIDLRREGSGKGKEKEHVRYRLCQFFNSKNLSLAVLGKPEIKDYSQKGSKLNVVFKDPLTPYRFPNGSFQSIQDIFQHDLEYKLYYWKDQSSGKVRSNSSFCSVIIVTFCIVTQFLCYLKS